MTAAYGKEQVTPDLQGVRGQAEQLGPSRQGQLTGEGAVQPHLPSRPRPCRVVVTVNRKRNLVVSLEDGGTFEVVLHRVWKGNAAQQDFLGFYVLDSHRMSPRTHGLLGTAGWEGRAVELGAEAGPDRASEAQSSKEGLFQ